MGEPSKVSKFFCKGVSACTCEGELKNSFFTEYKRFGVHLYVEGNFLRIQSTRIASKGNKKIEKNCR